MQQRNNKPNTNDYSVILHEEQQQQDYEIPIQIHNLDENIFITQQRVQPASCLVRVKSQSIWKQYQDETSKQPIKLLKLVINHQKDQLEQFLKQTPISINNLKFMDKWGLLHYAIQDSTLPIIRLLINNGANIQQQTSMKRRPIHFAVIKNSLETVQLLLQCGAIINCLDNDFCSPLHYAVDFGYYEIVKLILQKSRQTPELLIKNNRMMSVLDSCRDMKTLNLLIPYLDKYKILNLRQFNYHRNFIIADQDTFINLKSKVHYVSNILEKLKICLQKRKQQEKKQMQAIQNKEKKTKNPKASLNVKHSRLSSAVKLSVCNLKQSFMADKIQSLKDYDILRKIGEGSFGKVFLVRKKRSSNIFALKCITKSVIIQNKLKNYVLMERKVLLQIKNQFIVHAHSFFQDSQNLFMIMQFCPGGDLEGLLRKCKKLHQDIIKWYAAEIAIAVGCLHDNDILFRDLKTSNVLIDSKGHIKIADFGLAKQASVSYSFLGSKAYLAPQMLNDQTGKQHGPSIDWYLLGVLIYQLLTGFPPFYNVDQAKMFKAIKQSKPVFPQSLSKQGKNFLLGLLEKNPKKRLGFREDFLQIKSDAWFKDIDWDQVTKKKLPLPVPQVDYENLRTKAWEGPISDGKQDAKFIGWDHYELYQQEY